MAKTEISPARLKRIRIIRESIEKVARMLVGKKIRVRQAGSKAYVEYDQDSLEPTCITIPVIPDDASDTLLNAIQGFLDHEVAHVLYSDNLTLVESYKLGEIIKTYTNMFEDCYIERRVVKDFVGSAANLHKTRLLFIDRYIKPALEKMAERGTAKEIDYWHVLGVCAARAWSGQKEFIDFMADKWDLFPSVLKAVDKLKDEIPKARKSADNLELAIKFKNAVYGKKQPEEEESGDGDGDKKDDSDGEAEGEPTKSKTSSKSKGDDDVEDDDVDSDDLDFDPSDAGEESDDEEDEDEGSEDDDESEGDGESEDDDEEDEDGSSDDFDDKESDDEDGDDAEPEESDDDEEDDFEPAGSDDEDDEENESDDDESEEDSSAGESNDEDDDEESAIDAGLKGEEDDEVHDEDDEDRVLNEEELNQEDDPPFTEDDFEKERETFEAVVEKEISEMAASEQQGHDYVPYTTELDIIERFEAEKTAGVLSTVDEIEKQVGPMIGPLQKHLERVFVAANRSRWESGKRSGRLNAAGLARLRVDDDRVFRVKQVMKTKNVAVCLLIDCSGSMYGESIWTAMCAAWALGDVLDRLKIRNEILGFTTFHDYDRLSAMGGNTVYDRYRSDPHRDNFHRITPLYMPIFKEYGERFGVDVKQRIGTYLRGGPMHTNVDGECVRIAADRLLKQPEPGKTLIVLSDGFPSGGSSDTHLYGHLKKTAMDVEKQGVNLVGIGIGTEAPARFYRKHVLLNRTEDLPKTVIGELKSAIMQR